MDSRQQALEQWLQGHCQLTDSRLVAMQGDASFRRYFRVYQAERTFVAMDAPPERENCQPFVAIAAALKERGLCAPEIIASDLQQGFLLLTDFGERVYLKELNAQNAEEYYGLALHALSILQTCRQVPGWTVPLFTADFMRQELQLFKEWFLLQHVGVKLTPPIEKMLTGFFHFLAESAAAQPQVFYAP